MPEAGTHNRLELRERDGVVTLRCDGWELMSSRSHHSEEVLATLACAQLSTATPVILLGGLGLGYTLRALLDLLPAGGSVTVAELLPDVIAWNRGRLGHLAGWPLDDLRVSILCADITNLLRTASPGCLDAILLDVDNGPEAIMFPGNAALYAAGGLRHVHDALRIGGTLAVWSADRSPAFEQALDAAGFDAARHDVPARGVPGDPLHAIYIAQARQ